MSDAWAAGALPVRPLDPSDVITDASFRTPEQQEPRDRSFPAVKGRGDATRSIGAILMDEQEGERGTEAGDTDASGARDFAQSHFRRRNRLETRLEELQRDVAKLTTKLRSGSNRSASTLGHLSFDKSTDATTAAAAEQEAQVASRAARATPSSATKKLARPADATRRNNTPSELTTPSGRINRGQSNSVRTLRKLHNVTTERDQLRFELEKTKRSLALIEKKYQDAKRVKQAYEKLKVHCDSLQDSLELSEKIRVRQKKLLQQLQRQLEKQQTQRIESARKMSKADRLHAIDRSATPRRRREEPLMAPSRDDETVPHPYGDYEANHDGQIPREARDDYDILDSLVSPASVIRRSHRDKFPVRDEQPANEPTTARTRPRHKPAPAPTTPNNPYRSDFDKLLRTERPLQSRFTVQRPRQISTHQRVQERSVPRREPASMRSTTTQPTANLQQRARRKSPANRPKNSFLAPTKASLNRMHQVTSRDGDQRRPFIP